MGEAILARAAAGGYVMCGSYPGTCTKYLASNTNAGQLTRGNSVTILADLYIDNNNHMDSDYITPIDGFISILTNNLPIRINGSLQNGIIAPFKNGEEMTVYKEGDFPDDNAYTRIEIKTKPYVKSNGYWGVEVVVSYLAESTTSNTVTLWSPSVVASTFTGA